jgi:DNA primase
MSLNTAIKYLCSLVNLKYNVTFIDTSESDDVLYHINDAALEYFKSKLYMKEAQKYIASRDISEEMLGKFSIGYCDKTGLKSILEKQFNEEDIQKSGLLSFDGGNQLSHRLVFPIFDYKNRCIGFGGRTTNNNNVKYLNTKQTHVFQKGDTLYGINHCIKKKPIIVVEGYMDAVSLYQEGLENVVASMGTALTVAQAKLLREYTNEVFLSQDSDGPGTLTKIKSSRTLESAGLKVRIATTAPYKDPDEFIKNSGVDAYKERLGEALIRREFVLKNAENYPDIIKISDISDALIEKFRTSSSERTPNGK